MTRAPLRAAIAILLAAAAASLTGCEPTEPGEHKTYETYGTCTALDVHFRSDDDDFGSITMRREGSACSGLGARVRYRTLSGNVTNSQWRFQASTALISVSRSEASGSPESHHQICTVGGSCGSFTY